jgi:hypothetical protein
MGPDPPHPAVPPGRPEGPQAGDHADQTRRQQDDHRLLPMCTGYGGRSSRMRARTGQRSITMSPLG